MSSWYAVHSGRCSSHLVCSSFRLLHRGDLDWLYYGQIGRRRNQVSVVFHITSLVLLHGCASVLLFHFPILACLGLLSGCCSWHGHVTAVTVAPEFRRLGQANLLMDFLERVSEEQNTYFVDLYVRASNAVAIDMYRLLGYVIYRQVIGYYSGVNSEDAYDMRKAMSRDKQKHSMIPLPHPVHPGIND